MTIETKRRASAFVDGNARSRFERWCAGVRARSSTAWDPGLVETSIGPTEIHAASEGEHDDRPAIVVVPGFDTCGLFWDVADTLAPWTASHRVFLVDVVGQPGLSTGRCPKLRGTGYARWLVELLDALGLARAKLVGASFGASLIVRLAELAPERIERAVLLAPAGLCRVSLHRPITTWRLLSAKYLWMARSRTATMLDREILNGQPTDPEVRELMIAVLDIIHTKFVNRSDMPYVLPDEALLQLAAPTSVLVGNHDRLFDPVRLLTRAHQMLPNLVTAEILPDAGHGLEIAAATANRVLDLLG